MIPALIAQIGLPVLTRLVGGALRRIQDPTADAAADGLDRVAEKLDAGTVSQARLAEADRHLARLAAARIEAEGDALATVNRTMRAEIASDDPYVRRMRPTFGYVLAASWAAQMGAVAWTIIDDPARAGQVAADLAGLSVIWSVGLSVLGIYVYQRSAEKRGLAGGPGGPVGALAAIARRIAGGDRDRAGAPR
ncbi:MAG: 3TM-type holin [Azospirillaceae bacterium]